MESNMEKVMGYAARYVGKWSNGKVWTSKGVVNVGVFTCHPTADFSFKIRHINGHKVNLIGNNISEVVRSYWER